MSNYTRLSGSTGSFNDMIKRFGVVTVMNADIYDYNGNLEGESVEDFIAGLGEKVCHLDTLKIANVTEEGPTKTVTGGRYSNPLIKFGKSARLEMQDALGNIEAIDALCGGISEWNGTTYEDKTEYTALHFGEDYNGPKTIVGDSFFIQQDNGQQVKVKIIFYQFLPDSIFNLTQDAEGDATVFDMNGDLLTTEISIPNKNGAMEKHGLFYSILPLEDKKYVKFTKNAETGVVTAAKDTDAPASSTLTVDGGTTLTIAREHAALVVLKDGGTVLYKKTYVNE